MRKDLVSFAVFIMILLCAGCISFKIQSPPPPENELDVIQLCKNIDLSSDLLKPLDNYSEFTLEDQSVLCFVRLKKISSEVRLRWKWYSPDKKLIRDTENVVVNSDNKYLEIVTAYDELEISDELEENHKGEWTVVFTINDVLTAKKSFLVK
jgi:hypothetical protein